MPFEVNRESSELNFEDGSALAISGHLKKISPGQNESYFPSEISLKLTAVTLVAKFWATKQLKEQLKLHNFQEGQYKGWNHDTVLKEGFPDPLTPESSIVEVCGFRYHWNQSVYVTYWEVALATVNVQN